MKKRLLSMIVALCLICTVLPVRGIAAEAPVSGACGENLTWVLDAGGNLNVSGEGPMNDYDTLGENYAPWYDIRDHITAVVIGDGVTSVGEYAFFSCANMTSVSFGDSVSRIGLGAFYDCISLEAVDIPDSVTFLGGDAFYNCDAMKEISIGTGVNSIGEWTFACCDGLKSVTIPGSVERIEAKAFFDCAGLEIAMMEEGGVSIGESSFSWCSNLKTVTIPQSVVSIGDVAFSICDGLERVQIPAGVISIGDGAFALCGGLKEIRVEEGNPNYVSDDMGVLFDKEKTVLIQAPGAIQGAYVIPDSVSSVGGRAFECCAGLSEITFGGNVASVGGRAFAECTGLTEVEIPDGVTRIPNWTFYSCTALEKVTIPQSVKTIEAYAFNGCGALRQVYYGGTEEIWETVFIGDGNVPLLEAEMHFVREYREYEVLEGTDRVVELDSGKEVSIHVAGEISDFSYVAVDGAVVDPEFYTVTEGSTIVTFSGAYLQQLAEGEHRIEVHFMDGKATAFLKLVRRQETEEKPEVHKPSIRDTWIWMKHMAEWNTSRVESALDVNDDGKLNHQDAVVVIRKLAYWASEWR